jgi:flagellar hook protein FlgE
MFGSLSTALSALNAHSTGIDVVGNNLANLNTPGFKSSAIAFHDLAGNIFGAGLSSTQVGFGVARPVTLRQFSQGAIQSTGGVLDVAIQGDGMLIVRGDGEQTQYTRGGYMRVNQDGELVTATGQKLQGWPTVNGAVDTTSPVNDIVIPTGTLKEPKVTTEVQFDMNLNALAQNAVPSDVFSTSIQVFDALGAPHTLRVEFSKSATPNEWDYSITIPNGDVTTPIPPVTGTLTFDGQGALVSPAVGDPAPSIAITGLNNGAADMTIEWNLFSPNGLPNITQFAQSSSVATNSQDGEPASQLIRVSIANGGNVLAQYSNGDQRVVGQLAMASIRNPESLISVGENTFQLSASTALPAVGLPGTGGRGQIVGSAIENSTVDITREFTNLIVLQRGYQANARIVTTVDELSQETINLKR